MSHSIAFSGKALSPSRWFCQISRQTDFLGWDVKPSSPRVASKNSGLQMEENTVLPLLARNLTEPLVVPLDGALGLWRLAPQLFKPWKRVPCVLDTMHVVGYLWRAANALFGETSQAGKRWMPQKLTAILSGRVGDVIGGLRQLLPQQPLRTSVRETLARVITFFHNHRRWMQYDISLAAGVPVGTGVVESACGSVVKHRMEGEGKRWSLEGAEMILTLRSLKKSHDNDLRAYWRFRACQMQGCFYGHKPKYRPAPELKRVA
jgi:hypothetical protein